MSVLRLVVGVSLLSLFALGCARNGTRRDQLEQRAAFDLDCPREQLELQPLGEIPGSMGIIGSYGVKGCGKRATYVLGEGVWVANTPVPETE